MLWVCIFPKSAFASNLEFSPSNLTILPNSSGSFDIVLDASEKIVGVDLILIFDPGKIKITSISDLGVFSYKTKQLIDNDSGKVKLALSEVFGKTFIGNSHLATINFEAKVSTGGGNISFLFEKGKTKDTNVVDQNGKDVLTNVNSLSLTIENQNSVVSTTDTANNFATPQNVLAENTGNNNTTDKVLSANDSKFVFPESVSEKTDTNSQKTIPVSKTPTVTRNYFLIFYIVLFLVSTILAFLIGRKTNKLKITSKDLSFEG